MSAASSMLSLAPMGEDDDTIQSLKNISAKDDGEDFTFDENLEEDEKEAKNSENNPDNVNGHDDDENKPRQNGIDYNNVIEASNTTQPRVRIQLGYF